MNEHYWHRHYRYVCMDNATVEQAMEGSNYLTTYDIKSYETMTAISERFNKAVDKLVESVSKCGLHEYFKHRVANLVSEHYLLTSNS